MPRKEQKTAASRIEELLVGSGSRGMRKAKGLAPTSWRVALRLVNFLNRTLHLNLISSLHERAPVVEKYARLVDWTLEFKLNLIYFMSFFF